MPQEPGTVRGLEYQQQPTDRTCVHTCVAMALGVPVHRVIERVGQEALSQHRLEMILAQCGVLHDVLVHDLLGLWQGWHFATVPSLNFRGGSHQILLHWDDNAGLAVLDPARKDAYARDGSDLKSWSLLTIFRLGGKLPDKIFFP